MIFTRKTFFCWFLLVRKTFFCLLLFFFKKKYKYTTRTVVKWIHYTTARSPRYHLHTDSDTDSWLVITSFVVLVHLGILLPGQISVAKVPETPSSWSSRFPYLIPPFLRRHYYYFILLLFYLLWINKEKAKDKIYMWVSVLWKTTN